MANAFRERLRVAFAPPRYISRPFAGIDLSASGVKAVRLVREAHGLVIAGYAEERFPTGAYTDGEITDRSAVAKALATVASRANITIANVSLPEAKSYLFEATVLGTAKHEWRIAVEQRLEEFVPLPPAETVFDIVKTGIADQGMTRVSGVGFARRVVDDVLGAMDQAKLGVYALESETFAAARALLPKSDDSTTIIIDVGRTTTKIAIIEKRIPRFATTIGIGGHALTLAVQKHFGVTEAEARRVKADKGIVPIPGNEDYLSAMLSTVSAIHDEIARRFTYWQEKVAGTNGHTPITQAIMIGGNASVRGFPEYLEGALQIPVMTGDVCTNLATRDAWIPALDYTESLAYATAVGLALHDDIS